MAKTIQVGITRALDGDAVQDVSTDFDRSQWVFWPVR